MSELTEWTASSLLHRYPRATIAKNNFPDHDWTVFETLCRYQTLASVGLRSPQAGSAGPVLPAKRIGKTRARVGAVACFQCVHWLRLGCSLHGLSSTCAFTYTLLTLTCNLYNSTIPETSRNILIAMHLPKSTYTRIFQEPMKFLDYMHDS